MMKQNKKLRFGIKKPCTSSLGISIVALSSMGCYFPSDMLASIFERLPVKSLTRFKSLSNGCRDMISESKFIKNHRTNMASKEGHQDFILWRPHVPYAEQFPRSRFPYGRRRVVRAEILAPPPAPEEERLGLYPSSKVPIECDGLLCIPLEHNVIVWNPATKAHRTIPAPNELGRTLGFGYDSATDDYKVVNIHPQISGYQPTLIQTLRLKTGSWTIAKNMVRHSFNAGWQPTETIDGCIYWICEKREHIWSSDALFIASFDLEEDKMREVAFPDNRILRNTVCALGSMRGSLCLTSYPCKSEAHVHVWVMNAAAKSWEIVYKFPSYFSVDINSDFPSVRCSKTHILTNELSTRLQPQVDVFVYSFEDGSNLQVKKIEILGLNVMYNKTLRMIPHVESLVSPGL